MRIAAELLRKGQMAVGDISAAVGINDPNYFVKLFKKEFGETPSAFRKRHVI
jgi:YesN/AraC family two-component response regulator